MTRHATSSALLSSLIVLIGCGELVNLGPRRVLADGGQASTGAESGGGGAGEGGSKPLHHCDAESPVIWLRTFGDANLDRIDSLSPDGHGGVYVGGQYNGAIDLGGGPILSAGQGDIFIARLDGEGELVWAKRFGYDTHDEPYAIVAAHPDGVVLCGGNKTSMDFGGGVHNSDGSDAYVALLSPDGEHLWTTWVDGAGEEACNRTVNDPLTGDVVALGYFGNEARIGNITHTSLGDNDMLLMRFARADGAPLDSRAIGSTGPDFPRGLAVADDGRIVMSAQTTGSIDFGSGALPNIETDAVVALFEPNFDTVWARVYASAGYQISREPAFAPNGDIILSGQLRGWIDVGAGLIGDADGGFIARLAADNGRGLASVVLNGFDDIPQLRVDEAGDIVLVGSYNDSIFLGGESSLSAGSQDPVFAKLSPNFDLLWHHVIAGSPGYDIFASVALDEAANVFIAGHFRDTLAIEGCAPHTSQGDGDAVILKRRR